MEILGQSTKTVTHQPYIHLGYVAGTSRHIFWIPLIPAIIFLAVGIRQLHLHKKRYRKASILAIVGAFLFLLMSVGLFLDKPHIPSGIRTQVNYHVLSIAFSLYASEYDDRLPTSQQWCDLLKGFYDQEPNPFIMGDLKVGESAYAMNENVVNVKYEDIPRDVVLLFETGLGIEQERNTSILLRPFAKEWDNSKDYKVFRDCWNQVGGPQDITTDYHNGEGVCVLFGDGHTEFVPADNIQKLKWHPDEIEMPLKELK